MLSKGTLWFLQQSPQSRRAIAKELQGRMADSRAIGQLVTAGRTGLGAILGKTRTLGFGEY